MTLLNWIQSTLIVALILFVLNVLLEANVRGFIEHHGWDTVLTRVASRMSQHRPFWLALGVIIGAFAMSFAYPFLTTGTTNEVSASLPTSLKLQFYGDHRIPTEIGKENIYYWYAQFSPSVGVIFRDKDGNEIVPPGGAPSYRPTWDVFVILDKPTVRRQIQYSFSNPEKMWPAEILGETARSFIFHSVKEIPAGVLDLVAVK